MSSLFRITMLALSVAVGLGLATLLATLLAPAPELAEMAGAPPEASDAHLEPVPDDLACEEPAPAGAVHRAIIFGGNDPKLPWPASPTPDPVSDGEVAALQAFDDKRSLHREPTPAPPSQATVETSVIESDVSESATEPAAAESRAAQAVAATPSLPELAPAAPEQPKAAAESRPTLAQPQIATSPQSADTPDDLAGSLSRVAVQAAPERTAARPRAQAAAKPRQPLVIQPHRKFTQDAGGPLNLGGADFSKMMELLEQATATGDGGQGGSTAGTLLERLQKQGPAGLQDPALIQQLQSVAASIQQSLAPPSDEDDSLPVPEDEGDQPQRKANADKAPAPKAGSLAKPKATRKPEEDLQIVDEGDGKLYVHIQQEDIRRVLELLSEQGGKNILASPSVEGTVSASLNGVGIDEALDAILRSTGFVSRRDGNFIYVGTPEDFKSQDRAIDQVNTRVYRPNYIAAADLKQFIEPLLSEATGKCTVTVPAQIGIATNNSNAGGDSFGAGDAVVVQDYEAILAQIDQLVDEVDCRPAQVAIEAMILSVNLNDENQFGINWELLRNQPNVRFGIGTPRQAPLNGTGEANGETGAIIGQYNYTGGLSYAFLDSSLGSFLNALETVGDTDVIATPRLMCLNKQRAEILIGAQLGYISTTVTETSTAQSVQFLEVGAQLRLRPFISTDGLIRMEVHPELSTGQVRVAGGFTLPDKEVTQVTTNVIVRDGCTVIIGGLMREDLSTSTSQLPLVGNLPVVGGLFRQKTEKRQKREILVLITPHVINDAEAHSDGEKGAMEFHRRHGVVADKMNPVGKRLLARKYLRKAQLAWSQNDAEKARKLVDWAIQFDPQNRAAIDLRADIEAGRHTGDHSGGASPPQWPFGSPDEPADDEAEMIYDELEHGQAGGPPAIHDPGVPGSRQTLAQPARS